MSPTEPLRERFIKEARFGGDMPIDKEVYADAGLDWWVPILLGSGDLNARLGFFGRDPGRNEVHNQEPFIGKAGQHIRAALYRVANGIELPSIEESIIVGSKVFWGNTVPYKPIGNKAWSMKTKRRFAALVTEVLTKHWKGTDLITCGRVAFLWFGVAEPSLKTEIEAHWKRDDRFETSLTVELAGKKINLHPLPHPSPLNARWYKLFPDMLDSRLRSLKWPDDQIKTQ